MYKFACMKKALLDSVNMSHYLNKLNPSSLQINKAFMGIHSICNVCKFLQILQLDSFETLTLLIKTICKTYKIVFFEKIVSQKNKYSCGIARNKKSEVRNVIRFNQFWSLVTFHGSNLSFKMTVQYHICKSCAIEKYINSKRD